jgi:hypothetical protein
MRFSAALVMLLLIAGMAAAQAAAPAAGGVTTSDVSPLSWVLLLFKQILNIAGWGVLLYLVLFYINKKFGKTKSESLRRFEALIETSEDMCPDSLKGNHFEIGPTVDIGGRILGSIIGVGKLPVATQWSDPNPEYPDDFGQKLNKTVPYDKELVFVVKSNMGPYKFPLFSSLAKKKVYRVPSNIKRCHNVVTKEGKRYFCGAPVRHNPVNSNCWRCGGPIPVYHSFPLAGDVRIYSSGFDKVGRYYFPNERDDGEILHTLEMDSLNLKYMQMLDMNVEIVESAIKANPKVQIRKELTEDSMPGNVKK